MACENFKPYQHFATNAVHCGQEPDQWKTMAVIPPIFLTTTFAQKTPGATAGYDYIRGGNPTRDCLQKCLAALENGKYAFVFGSGLAACDTIIHQFSHGDHIISSDDMYGGVNRFFRRTLPKQNIEMSFVNLADVDNLKKAMKPNTRLVWMESPSNPLLKLCDIQQLSKIAHDGHPDCIVVVDNTFATPYFQRPLDLGADIVVHSMTKFINGHSDVLMGCLITKSEKIAEKLKFAQMAIGAVPSPFDCYLANRGLKTLPLRMKASYSNTMAIAKYLETSPRVERVLYPGLPSHPQYELAKRQMIGYSGVLSFFIKGTEKEAIKFLENVKVFTLAESLGGFESLADHPAIMTHASIAKEEREALGIFDNLIRLSVGIEDEEDLIADLDNALKIAVPNIE